MKFTSVVGLKPSSTDLNKLTYMGEECVRRSCEIKRGEALSFLLFKYHFPNT